MKSNKEPNTYVAMEKDVLLYLKQAKSGNVMLYTNTGYSPEDCLRALLVASHEVAKLLGPDEPLRIFKDYVKLLESKPTVLQ